MKGNMRRANDTPESTTHLRPPQHIERGHYACALCEALIAAALAFFSAARLAIRALEKRTSELVFDGKGGGKGYILIFCFLFLLVF
jgi:hypothetical protein